MSPRSEIDLQLVLMESAPPTPSLGSTPHLNGSEDDDVLACISRMLMEDDFVDEFLHEYDPDQNPALLQAQQLFAHVLSDSDASDALAGHPFSSVELPTYIDAPASTALPSTRSNIIHDPASLNGTATDAVEPSALLTAESTSCFEDVVSMAYLKGMEEANKLLPSNGVAVCGGRGQKKRLDGEAGMGRSSKQMAADGGESEEAAALEMLDQLMLNGDEPNLADMQELRAAMNMEDTPRGRGRGRRRGSGNNAEQAVDLHSMLIRCAEAVAKDDRPGAAHLLEQIRRHSSPRGDVAQRLAHCFAEGLAVRLAGTGYLHYRSLAARNASSAGVLKAHQFFKATCCFVPVSTLFSNKTIHNAVAGRKKLHIVNYGLYHGLQWVDLLRWLANREGGPPEVRLTGIDIPQPGFRPARLMEEIGRRLSACAHRLGVPFRFRAIAAKSESVHAGDLDIDPDEVLVVNCLYHFRKLMDKSIAVDGTDTNPVDAVLTTIREMRPSVFIHATVNASYDTAFFATRFREALYCYTAMFDMMDAILPRDNEHRLRFERDVLAQSAVNFVACEGADRVQWPRSYKQWQARSSQAGLRQLPLDPGLVQMVKDKVKKEYHKCFVISEDGQWLLQGWKGRVLHALSTWTALDDLAAT